MQAKTFLLFLICGIFFFSVQAQNLSQKQRISKTYDQNKLHELSEKHQKIFDFQQERINRELSKKDWPRSIQYPNGDYSELIRINELGFPEYRRTYSIQSGQTIGADQVYPEGSMGLNLEGEGMKAGVWDSGKVRATHELLTGKITHKDQADSYRDHPTLVAGILAGKKLDSGNGQQAKGTAYKANLDAYDWNNDLAEMTNAAAEGLLVSNHSYGRDMEQLSETIDIFPLFGAYDTTSSAVDELSYEAPYYIIVSAAGNDRIKDLNPDEEGYNILGAEMTTAKNNIVVAAVHPVMDYEDSNSVTMSNFSSWGPTNDNRIKPDIAADGVGVYSSVAFYPPLDPDGVASDSTYVGTNGTSMAAPSVAGGLLLLQELSGELNEGSFLKSATLKALTVHTARQVEALPGPNPRSGWGLFNIQGIAELMLEDHEFNKDGGRFYEELNLENQQTFSKTIIADGSEKLKVSVAWTDPKALSQLGWSGPGGDGVTVDPFPVLINDLDLRITDSEGNVFYPWRLNPDGYDLSALNDADNAVDNVEQVVISNPLEGEEYTITVSHKAELQHGEQDFSLVASGIKNELSVNSDKISKIRIYPNPATDFVFVEGINIEDNHQVYDITGKQMQVRNTYENGTSKLDISNLSEGIYFLKILKGNEVLTKKIVVK